MATNLIDELIATGHRLRECSDPVESVRLAHQLSELATELERQSVRSARQQGASWSGIGAVFGLSKQGAQQRFGKKPKEGKPSS